LCLSGKYIFLGYDLLVLISVVSILSVLLTLVVLVYGTSAAFWLFETSVLAPPKESDESAFEWGPGDVQVRISTIAAANIVQTTVDTLPETITDVHVIAEAPIDVEGATVHVVPAGFECAAGHKGRALEWARRHVPCRKEYVLFLDEDTLVTEFEGLPDDDVVQFTELPLYTGSRWAYLCEVFRIGYQYEQRAFARFAYPLYVWGGGIAIRRSVEEQVTWDRRTITEDTAFVWTAAAELGISMSVVDTKFRNQAPPSIRGMIRQRRRWMSGTREDGNMLPLTYRALISVRAVVWALSPLIVILGALTTLVPGVTVLAGTYVDWLVLVMLVFLHFVTWVGASVYGFGVGTTTLAVVLTIPIVLLNTVGALWGFLSPTRAFTVTPKVTAERIERSHPTFRDSDGDLEETIDQESNDMPLDPRRL